MLYFLSMYIEYTQLIGWFIRIWWVFAKACTVVQFSIIKLCLKMVSIKQSSHQIKYVDNCYFPSSCKQAPSNRKRRRPFWRLTVHTTQHFNFTIIFSPFFSFFIFKVQNDVGKEDLTNHYDQGWGDNLSLKLPDFGWRSERKHPVPFSFTPWSVIEQEKSN